MKCFLSLCWKHGSNVDGYVVNRTLMDRGEILSVFFLMLCNQCAAQELQWLWKKTLTFGFAYKDKRAGWLHPFMQLWSNTKHIIMITLAHASHEMKKWLVGHSFPFLFRINVDWVSACLECTTLPSCFITDFLSYEI